MNKGIQRLVTLWHHARMKYALLLLLVAGNAAAAFTGRVVDEAGKPIQGAEISTSQESAVTGSDGTFQLDSASEPVSMRVDAQGYFSFIHTLIADDRSLADIVLVEKKPQRRLLMFAGDAMLSRRYFEPRANEPVLVSRERVFEDGKRLLRAVRPYIELADFASVNLETQLADKEPAKPLPKLVTYYSPPEFAELLRWAGFDYAALGNNHTYDFREAGVKSTLKALDKAGLPYSGAGVDEASARKPYVAAISGRSFAHLSYVGWAGTFKPSQAASGKKGGAALGNSRVFGEDLASIPNDAVSILQFHRGIEYAGSPAMTERTSLRHAIDHGADLAIGHHPHVIQGFELYRDTLISYSMGNFLFDQYHYTTQLGMLLFVWMDGDRFHRAEVVPLDINGYVPTPATGAFRYAVLNRLGGLSAENGVCMTHSGAHAVIRDDDQAAACGVQELRVDVKEEAQYLLPLANAGVSPLRPVFTKAADTQYRIGTNLLPRGDFETAGLFGTDDKTWIEAEGISLREGDSTSMRVVAGKRETVRAGMKVFERVFTASSPATVSGKIRIEGDATISLYLQRRRPDDGLSDALESGPLIPIGKIRGRTTGWQRFSFDFEHPRISTRSVRLVMDIKGGNTPVTVDLDDLTWVEWQTPWLWGGEDANAAFGSHVQLRKAAL